MGHECWAISLILWAVCEKALVPLLLLLILPPLTCSADTQGRACSPPAHPFPSYTHAEDAPHVLTVNVHEM